jgi:hypothetical protein
MLMLTTDQQTGKDGLPEIDFDYDVTSAMR